MVEVERRRVLREPVYYSATLAFNTRASTISCLVRNINEFGAKIQLSAAFTIPTEVDFAIDSKQISGKAHLVWRDEKSAGLAFSGPLQPKDTVSSDWKRRLDTAERTNRQLRDRLERLTSD